MQDYFSCYLKIVYLNLEWLIEISPLLVVKEFIDLLNLQFQCDVQGKYLYELKSKRILDTQKTFSENDVKSGDYLYFI